MHRRTPTLPVLLALGCAACTIKPLPRPDASSSALAIDDDALYWADPVLGGIYRQPRDATTSSLLTSATPDDSLQIMVTSSEVVWLDAGLTIRRVANQGGASSLVATGNAGPIGIAADDEFLYHTRSDANDQPELVEVALDSGEERIVDRGLHALGLALDGEDVFGTSCSAERPGDGVWRVPRAGGERVVVVPNTYCPIAIAVAGEHVYFADRSDAGDPAAERGVLRAPTEGGSAEFVAASGAFAVAEDFVYAVQEDAIVRVAADGETVTMVRVSDAVGVAIGDDTIYWTVRDADGALGLRHAKLPD